MIKAVIFDVGGTLIDSNKELRQKMFERVFKKYRLNVKNYDEFWLKVLEVTADADIGKIKNTQELWECVFNSRLNKKIVKELDNAQLIPKKLYDDVKNVLETLGKKYKLAIISNANPDWFYLSFKKFKLKKNFDVVIVSAEVGIKKPNKKIFEIALKKLKLEPEETIYIGNDPVVDIQGAKSIGLNTVLIVRKKEVLEEIETLGIKPDFIIDNLYELKDILKDLYKMP